MIDRQSVGFHFANKYPAAAGVIVVNHQVTPQITDNPGVEIFVVWPQDSSLGRVDDKSYPGAGVARQIASGVVQIDVNLESGLSV